MFATVDNPSNAVEWAMAEMINQPEILKTTTKELDRVVGKERLIQECDMPHLNYIKACIQEAFRLHPIVPFNAPHMAMSAAIVAGYFIPKGSHVLLSRLGLGRNPKVWNKRSSLGQSGTLLVVSQKFPSQSRTYASFPSAQGGVAAWLQCLGLQ